MRRVWLTLVCLLVVAAVVATSAGGSEGKTPKRGGTVTVAGGFHLACLNPLSSLCGDRQATSSSGLPLQVIQTLEGDFKIKPDLTYEPNLVASVTWTKRPPWRLTYHIRPEARWSDGVPITSSDFAFSFQAFLKTLDLLSDDPVKAIQRIRKINTKTFRVTLRSRSAQWRASFYTVLPQHALAGQDLTSIWKDTIDNPKTGDPIGSGPFLVKSFDQQTGELTLVRNPRYWGLHKAYVDRIIFRDVQDPVAALRRSEIDLAPDLNPDDALALKHAPGVNVVATAGQLWTHLEIRLGPGGNAALGKKLIRQALAYGIDREAIVRKLYGDATPALHPVHSAIFLSQSPYYKPNWRDYRYQPAGGRRLLDEAGCRRGTDGIYSCGGHRLSLRFFTVAGNPIRQQTLELVQRQLRRIGVEVRPVYAPPATLFGQILPSGEFDVALVAFDYSQELFYRFSIFACHGQINWTGYCNPSVTRDLRTSVHFLDQDARDVTLNRVDRQMARDVPVIPLYQRPDFFGFKTALNGVTENLVEGLAWNSENWWVER